MVVGIGSLNLTIGGVCFMHNYSSGLYVMPLGFMLIMMAAIVWFRDIIREGSFQGHHSKSVKSGLKMGMILFIVVLLQQI